MNLYLDFDTLILDFYSNNLFYLLLFSFQIDILLWPLELLTRPVFFRSRWFSMNATVDTVGQSYVTLVRCLFPRHSREDSIQMRGFGLLSWLLVRNTSRYTKYAGGLFNCMCDHTVSSGKPKVTSHSAFLLAHYIIPAARWRNAVKDCPRKIRTCAHVVLSTLGIHPRRTRSASNLFIGNFADNRCSIKLPPLRTCSREYLHSMYKLMARHASSRLTDSVAALADHKNPTVGSEFIWPRLVNDLPRFVSNCWHVSSEAHVTVERLKFLWAREEHDNLDVSPAAAFSFYREDDCWNGLIRKSRGLCCRRTLDELQFIRKAYRI